MSGTGDGKKLGKTFNGGKDNYLEVGHCLIISSVPISVTLKL